VIGIGPRLVGEPGLPHAPRWSRFFCDSLAEAVETQLACFLDAKTSPGWRQVTFLFSYLGDNPSGKTTQFFEWGLQVDKKLTKIINRRFPVISELVCGAYDIAKLPPASIKEALFGPNKIQWNTSIEKKLDQMNNLGVFKPADVQTGPGMKIGLLLKVMYDNDYSVKMKARQVAYGYYQGYMRDIAETYSPTIPIAVIFITVCVALHRGLRS
jgi:hypothetical protein